MGLIKNLDRVNITFSRRCNLCCPFCLCKKQKSDRRELNTPEWLDFIDELSTNKVFHVGIWGGEPFFGPELRTIVDRIVAGRMRFRLITNGSCIDDALLEHIARSRRCDHVQFSLDGFEDDHDAGRGGGAFQKTLAAIRRAGELQLKILVNTVISRRNYRSAPGFAEFLETLPVHTYRLNLIDLADLPGTGYQALTTAELAEMIEALASHFDRLPHLSPHSPAKRYWRQLQSPQPPDAPCEVCRAPAVELTVRPDGAFIPCGGAADRVLGYVNRDRLADVWRGAKLEAFRKRLLRGRERNEARCRECIYRCYCRKFCPGTSGKRHCRQELAALLRERGVLR